MPVLCIVYSPVISHSARSLIASQATEQSDCSSVVAEFEESFSLELELTTFFADSVAVIESVVTVAGFPLSDAGSEHTIDSSTMGDCNGVSLGVVLLRGLYNEKKNKLRRVDACTFSKHPITNTNLLSTFVCPLYDQRQFLGGFFW